MRSGRVRQCLELAGGWGVLNQAATGVESFDQRPDVLTIMDFTCVDPLRRSAVDGGRRRAGLTYRIVNRLVSATKEDLSRVHTVPDPY